MAGAYSVELPKASTLMPRAPMSLAQLLWPCLAHIKPLRSTCVQHMPRLESCAMCLGAAMALQSVHMVFLRGQGQLSCSSSQAQCFWSLRIIFTHAPSLAIVCLLICLCSTAQGGPTALFHLVSQTIGGLILQFACSTHLLCPASRVLSMFRHVGWDPTLQLGGLN